MPAHRLPAVRLFLAGLTAAALSLPGVAAAQQRGPACATPAETNALEVRALQSKLMVVALTCGLQDEYNRFVTQHRAALGSAYNDVRRHFQRLHGAAAQRQLDSYITNTANGHSQVGISQGSLFCRNQADLFPAALAARNRDQLAALARERQVAQVYTPPSCGSATQVAAQSRPPASQDRPAQPQSQRSQPASQPQSRPANGAPRG
ncbi:MAG: hypothetical protein N2588_08515 [Rhodovarius sp.]|nr:hypothetical protein [Rhodovarius sp.]